MKDSNGGQPHTPGRESPAPLFSEGIGTESYKMRIGAAWVGSSDGRTRPVLNPATGEAFAEVPEGTREDARAALEAARDAQPAWEALTGVQRAAYLQRVVELIR